jgi:hypothetical protein
MEASFIFTVELIGDRLLVLPTANSPYKSLSPTLDCFASFCKDMGHTVGDDRPGFFNALSQDTRKHLVAGMYCAMPSMAPWIAEGLGYCTEAIAPGAASAKSHKDTITEPTTDGMDGFHRMPGFRGERENAYAIRPATSLQFPR